MIIPQFRHKIPNIVPLGLAKLFLHGIDPMYALQGFLIIRRKDSGSVAHVIQYLMILKPSLHNSLNISNDVVNKMISLFLT